MKTLTRPTHSPVQEFPDVEAIAAPQPATLTPIRNEAAVRWNQMFAAYGDGLACECLGHVPRWVERPIGDGVKIIARVDSDHAQRSRKAHGFIVCAACQERLGVTPEVHRG